MPLEDVDHLIKYYFGLGFQQIEIRLLLSNHNIEISERQLKRRLQKIGLFRRKNYSDIETVYNFISDQIEISGQLHGYKWMHLRCIQSGLQVKQETVRHALKVIDPMGVSRRSRRRLQRRQYSNSGPNFIWHMDAYDKLKPYGISISGCIDGFSRKIIWLKASQTCNDPKVIAGFYVDSVQHFEGTPLCIRSDMGTENGSVEDMQFFFRQRCTLFDSAMPSFLYGTSQANQRIESWWSILRKHNSQFWMNLFQQIKDDGYYTGTFIDKSLIQFCFMDIIQVSILVFKCYLNFS